MRLLGQLEEEARIEKPDGRVIGPIKASFAGSTIIVRDEKVDIEEGDVIIRQLPSGRDERNIITNATFYSRGLGSTAAHFQLKFHKGGQSEEKNSSHTINIHGAQSVQVGDYNTQNIINSFEILVKKIESADASPEEKEEAKGMLRRVLEHPLVVSVIGAAVGAVF